MPRTSVPTRTAALTLATALAALASPALARNLGDDFEAALRYEPNYANAQTQTRNMRIDANIASTAYFPRAGLSLSQDAYDNSTRRTARIVQPLVSADRWLTTREAKPREAIADHLSAQARINLAARMFSAVRELVLSRESLTLTQSTLKALQAQSDSAQLAYKVGQGTITDVLDTQVRVAQTRSQILRLQADYDSNRRTYASVTGYMPADGAYPLSPRTLTRLAPPALQDAIDQALKGNPQLQAERQATQLSAITARRSRAQFMPSLNATWQRSQTANRDASTINGVVLSLDVPIQYSIAYAFEAADNTLLAQQQKERATTDTLLLDVQRLHAQALAGQQEVEISRDAIEAANQSVAANERSFAGGVRTKIDVLNALQAQLQARQNHLSAQLTLAYTLFNLRLLAAQDIAPLLAELQQELFEPTP